MPVVLIANPKGGVGKSTLATHVAGYFANQGHWVMLGDIDRQQSARLWLGLRPAQLAPIRGWDARGEERVLRPPRGTTHAVLDSPAGLHGKKLKQVLTLADRVLIPVQPSLFDIYATADFVDQLRDRIPAGVGIGLVAMRVGIRTLAAQQLRQFFAQLRLPVVGELRDTQNYVQLAARGMTLFDMPAHRVQRDLQQWEPVTHWLDTGKVWVPPGNP